ncbi:MAG: hypothetical protein EOO90_00940 [Pedobacter sp.]|nr:MAG: hypothetical protein EOO90_00940 [Pedobacter sp.]
MKINIVSYLLELLESKKSVGIGALGTVRKKKLPGRYDSETHSFLPPKHEISFDTEIEDDGELASFIGQRENISIELAASHISDFVENLNSQLTEQQHADFSPIGVLKVANGQVILEPAKESKVNLEFYGLPSVSDLLGSLATKAPSNQDLGETNQSIKTTDNEESAEDKDFDSNETPQAEATFDTDEDVPGEPIIQEQKPEEQTVPLSVEDPLWKPTVLTPYEYGEDDDLDENEGRGMRIFLRSLLVLVIVGIAAAVVYFFFFPDLFNRQPLIPEIEDASSVIIPVPDTTLNKKPDSIYKDTVVAKPIVPTIQDVKVKTDTPVVYEVIGSAMKTQKKIDEVIAILARRGIKARQLDGVPGRLIKISLGSFEDYNKAKKYQDSLKIKLKNPDIYIQTIKPKE